MENVLQYMYAAVGPLLWVLAITILIASFAAMYGVLTTSKMLTGQEQMLIDTEYSANLVEDGYTDRAEVLGLLAVQPSVDITVYGSQYTVVVDINEDRRTHVVVKDSAGVVYFDTVYDEDVWNLELAPTQYVTNIRYYRAETFNSYTGELQAVSYTAQEGS